MKDINVALEEDDSLCEINILPDGRVCLFGASKKVLEALDAVPLGDPALTSRIERLRTTDMSQTGEPHGVCSAQIDGTVKKQVRQ
jgi:hypothetical protein